MFHKTSQTQRETFCPQLHPCKSNKVYKYAHICKGVFFYKILHITFLICYVWEYKLFTPDTHNQFLQEANKQNINTLYIYQYMSKFCWLWGEIYCLMIQFLIHLFQRQNFLIKYREGE